MQAATGKPLSPAEGDSRYGGDARSQWPFNVYARSYGNYVIVAEGLASVPGVARE